MAIAIILVTILLITLMQSAIPYLLKQTTVFGVTIPEGHTNDETLAAFKKLYSYITLSIGLVAVVGFSLWAFMSAANEESIVLTGLSILLVILFSSMTLYFLLHAKTTHLKAQNGWGANLKQIRITDIAARTADEMLPWYIYLLPIIITIGFIAYTITQYAQLPELIPTHWGIDGQPDAFATKTPLSAISSLLILSVMQVMMLGINELIKRSGIKINATRKNKSRAQQLSFRKYTSWFLFMTTLLLTGLFTFMQLTTIHSNLSSSTLLFALPLCFLALILVMTALYAFKVGQSGSRLDMDIEDEVVEGITDYDDDHYWKAGIFYFNKDDPSMFVEKRFGVGWSINYAHPLGYIILFVPIIIILVISLLI